MAQSGFLEINDARIKYTEQGSGFPLIFLHSGITDSRQWDTQISAFAAYFRVVTYDFRGYGESSKPDAPFSFRADLLGVFKALNIEKAHLIGASQGGSVAINFTLENPDRVEKLVLVAPGLNGYKFGDPAILSFYEEKVDPAEESGDLDAVNALEMQIWLDGITRSPDKIPSEMRELVLEMNLIALKQEEIGIFQPIQPPAIERLESINKPALVIIGSDDVADMQSIANMLTDRLPDVRKSVMDGCTHLPNMEQPATFNQKGGLIPRSLLRN